MPLSFLPRISFRQLYHVGSLDANHKKSYSLEGSGLSVSLHPQDWINIARLGEGKVWTATRRSNCFLDFHSLSQGQREAIIDWGVTQDYIQRRTVWDTTWFDDEFDCELTTTFSTYQNALDESYDGSEPTSRESFVATEKFPDLCIRKGMPEPFDILCTVFIKEETEFDGVWWEDDYNVAHLSAPRGVIDISRLSHWKFSQEETS